MSQVTFSFFLKSKKNNKNQSPIVLTISMNGKRTQHYTGLWINPKRWNSNAKTIRGNDDESKTLNDTLISLVSHGRRITNELLISGQPFNSHIIKQKIKHGLVKSIGVVEGFELFVVRMDKLVGTKYARPTLVKYTNTKERVKEFIKHYTQRGDIFLYELNSQFMEDFDLWLRKKYNVSHNTVYKTYQRFTRYIRFEMSLGNIQHYPFPNYEIRMEYKQGHYLTYDEILLLEKFEIENQKLTQVKHLFLFSIYCGLSYVDLYNLKDDNLIIDNNGTYWLKTYRQKSRSRVSVPLLTKAINSLNILRSGQFPIPKGKLLPVNSNSHLNIEIKSICGLSGIKNSHLVTWHSSRRSLSSLMMEKNIPLQVLQKVLSHKSLHTSIQFYTHTDDEMVCKAMKELDSKLK
jgi:integrase